jgi:hypothetical protein
MPTLPLTVFQTAAPLRVDEPTGTPLAVPLSQLRCLAQLPGVFLPRDAIIDTGSPLSWMPERVWNRMSEGTDYEVLPWSKGFVPPPGRTAGWNFTYRIARLLRPLTLFVLNANTTLVRDQVVVQLADGNPPAFARSNNPLHMVVGLWGGVLEGTALRVGTAAAGGHTVGALEW